MLAYNPKKSVDGIVVCRCAVPFGQECSYHPRVVNLLLIERQKEFQKIHNRFVDYYARKIQGDGNTIKKVLKSLRDFGNI